MACLMLVLSLAGCGLFGQQTAPGSPLRVPAGTVWVTAWLPDGYIYFLHAKDAGTSPDVWRAAPGRPAERVTLPALANCRRTEYLLPHRLPDGRLGLARWCMMDDSSKERIDLVAVSPAHPSQVQMLAPLGDNNPGTVSWRPGLRSGYLSHGSGICDGIAPLTRSGPVRFPRPVTLAGHTWRLDEELFTQADDCQAQGRADFALLTADQRGLVFFASPDSQGHDGQSRLDYPWNLYVWQPPGQGQPRLVVTGFDDIRGMDIAPGGTQAAVAARRGSTEGLWLVDLKTGRLRKIGSGHLDSPTFSPDGRRLAVVLTHDVDHDQLRVVDLQKLAAERIAHRPPSAG